MITIDTQEQLLALLDKDGNLNFKDNLTINIDISISGDIDAWHIKAWNIDAWNIKANDIDAWNIKARNIDANDIDAWNIKARNIDAWNIISGNIDAINIDARNIDAWHIKAWDISYDAVCFAYDNIVCNSIKGIRRNSRHFALDGELKINIKEV